MPIHNTEIAAAFEQLADLLEIENANTFRVRAYRNAALTLRTYGKSMANLLEAGEDLSKLPDIGKDLANKIKIMIDTGKLPLLDKVKSRTPAALSDLLRIQGLGPKRVRTLYKELQIQNMDDLKHAAINGKIRELEGFGKKTEQLIKQGVEKFIRTERRTKLSMAEDIAIPLIDYLKSSSGIKEIILAGSYRRCKETVGDLDILITAKKNAPIMDRFTDYDEVADVISKGKTRSTVLLRSGLQVDLRVVPQVSFGSALQYFTGSKSHNIAVRKLGAKKGYKINEYGVFENDKRIAGKTEAEVYEKVGLPYIPPELRENRGELAISKKTNCPN